MSSVAEVLSPQPGQALITSEHRNHDHQNHGHHDPEFDMRNGVIRDAYKATVRGIERQQKDSSDLGQLVAASQRETIVALKESLATQYQIEGRMSVQAEKNTAQLGVQAEKLGAAQILEATKNAAAISKQLAECCCELKELVREDGDKTRALLNANLIQDLRDRAAKAETALVAFYTRNVPPVTPVVAP